MYPAQEKLISWWQKFTLTDLPLSQWQNSSLIYRWVGILSSWKEGSWLLPYGEIIASGLVALVFGLAPFIPNELLGLLLVGLAGIWVLLMLTDNRQLSQLSPIHITVLVFWGLSIVSTAMSPVKDAAFNGLFKLTLYLIFFAILSKVLIYSRIRQMLVTIYLLVALVVSCYGVQQSIYGAKALATWVDPDSPLSKVTRAYSYLNNPNLLAAYLLPAIAFSVITVILWRGWWPKTLAVVMLGVNTYCLFATQTRGCWIALFVMILFFYGLLWYWYKPQLSPFWANWGLPLGLLGFIAVIAVGVLFIPNVRDRFSSIFVSRKDSSNNFRINVWDAVQKMIKDRPLFGIGTGDRAFKKVYPYYQVNPRYSALSAYSIILETIVETGFIGLAAFIWMIVVTLQQGLQPLGTMRDANDTQGLWLMGAIVAIIGLLIQGFFDTVWYRPEVYTIWWFLLAFIASRHSVDSKQLTVDSQQ